MCVCTDDTCSQVSTPQDGLDPELVEHDHLVGAVAGKVSLTLEQVPLMIGRDGKFHLTLVLVVTRPIREKLRVCRSQETMICEAFLGKWYDLKSRVSANLVE